MEKNKNLKIINLEEICTDQLIWDIENSDDFLIYEINDSSNETNILVKIISSQEKYN